MTQSKLEKVAWLAICTTYLAWLELKMCNDGGDGIAMTGKEIDLYHMTPEQLANSKVESDIKEVNSFDIYKIFQ